MITSSSRMIVSSTALREVAATAPMIAPVTRARPVAPRPMISDQRAPYSSLEKMSRLALSSPIQCSADGPPPSEFWKYGECGARSGANSAASTTTSTMPTASHDSGGSLLNVMPGRARRSVSPRLMRHS